MKISTKKLEGKALLPNMRNNKQIKKHTEELEDIITREVS